MASFGGDHLSAIRDVAITMPTRILEQLSQGDEGLPGHPRAFPNGHPLAMDAIEHPPRDLKAVLARLLIRQTTAQSATLWAGELSFNQKLSAR